MNTLLWIDLYRSLYSLPVMKLSTLSISSGHMLAPDSRDPQRFQQELINRVLKLMKECKSSESIINADSNLLLTTTQSASICLQAHLFNTNEGLNPTPTSAADIIR
ncbi:hypothetical protein KOW79_012473 [Hemibagrus wyckioides]|uniref:Uncharacterized protein n=1 Tax=Hemibagrus wyckioides TaxID=337641 RepID=A0A9D3SHL8_9TELE|nr:hypothetical protein KOW79_012473 [Hemibagrus wyckioides]